MNRRLLIAVISIVSIGLPTALAGQYPPARGLFSEDSAERAAAYARYERQHQAWVDELLAVLDAPDVDRTHGGTLHLAIRLLGELRARDAVEPLRELLTFVPSLEGGLWVQTEDLPTEAYYVAAVALTRIGKPATEPMLLVIRNSSDPLERDLAAWVLKEIEGDALALYLLARRASAGTQGKERFEQAREYIENWTHVSRHPLISEEDFFK